MLILLLATCEKPDPPRFLRIVQRRDLLGGSKKRHNTISLRF